MMHPPRRSSLPSILLFCLFLANLISFTSAIFTYQGCYTIDNIRSLNNTWSFQSSGWCGNHYAVPENFAVFGMSGAQCYVGDSIPANQVDGSKCSMGCPGYGNESCIFIPEWADRRWCGWISDCLLVRCRNTEWQCCYHDHFEPNSITHSERYICAFKHDLRHRRTTYIP